MNKIQLSAIVAGISLVTGIYFANSSPDKNLPLAVGIGSGGLLLGVGSTMFATQKINERKFKTLIGDKAKLEQTKTDLEVNTKLFSTKANTFEKEVKQLTTQLSEATVQLKLIKEEKLTADYQNIEHVKSLTKLQETNRHLITNLEKLQETIADKDSRISELNTELEDGWGEQLTTEAEKVFKQRAENILVEEMKHDKYVAEKAMELCREYMQLAEEMFDDNEQHHEKAMTVNDRAKQVITNLKKDGDEALGDKEDYIRGLQLKINDLTAQLNGEILEPEKTKGAIGRHWIVANHLIEHIGELGINLRITGVEECPECDVIAFGYSKSAVPTQICELINQHGKDWAKSHGVHFIGNARLSKRYPAIEVTLIIDRPKVESTESIYKDGLIPASKFGETIYKAITHDKKGKPTLRIMAATGDGKGIVCKNLLAYWLTLEQDWDIWLSDPVSGSDEDYWDCEKVAINRTEARQAYDYFYQIYQGRKAKKLETIPKMLGLFDEFDSEHTEEQHEQAQEIMGRIRHLGMHQILVGQSAEVGRNGWTWDAMKNCALLVLEGSIGTLRKHLVPDLGWTVQQKNKMGKEYDKYRRWADAENEANPDRPVENQTRIGLLVIGDRYQFLEIPIAHKGILQSTNKVLIQTTAYAASGVKNNTLTKTVDLKATNSNQNTVLQSNDPLTMIACPYCNSINVGKQGKNAKGQQYYSCKDCKHKPRKWTY